MKKSVLTILAVATSFGAAPAFAAYLPSGPQTNVALSTVTSGGWTQCYGATMGTPFGTSAATTLSACSGNRLMLAGRATGSNTLLVLAQALKVDALFDTGAADNDVFHTSNGSDWFYADNYSWGFKTIGSSYRKFECDTSPPTEPSMCVHTLSGVGGYNINDIGGLNGSSDYEKLVFAYTDTGAVPEPATWAMMLMGFGVVGGAMRRRQKVNVSFA